MTSEVTQIATIYDPEEAYVVRSYLQANGIDVRLADAQAMAVLPLHRIALGGHRIFVPAEQAASARALLQAAHEQEPAKGFRFDGVTCPSCGEASFTRVKPWFLPIAILLTLGAPIWWNSKQLRCTQCGRVSDEHAQ